MINTFRNSFIIHWWEQRDRPGCEMLGLGEMERHVDQRRPARHPMMIKISYTVRKVQSYKGRNLMETETDIMRETESVKRQRRRKTFSPEAGDKFIGSAEDIGRLRPFQRLLSLPNHLARRRSEMTQYFTFLVS